MLKYLDEKENVNSENIETNEENVELWTDEMLENLFIFQPPLSLRSSSNGKPYRGSQKILTSKTK
jgi:hypothetical protein